MGALQLQRQILLRYWYMFTVACLQVNALAPFNHLEVAPLEGLEILSGQSDFGPFGGCVVIRCGGERDIATVGQNHSVFLERIGHDLGTGSQPTDVL